MLSEFSSLGDTLSYTFMNDFLKNIISKRNFDTS